MTSSSSSIAVGVSVAAAVVGAVIYVLWGPDKLLRRRGRCPGLQNLGNTCFVNAILQALASAKPVVVWLQSVGGGRLTRALHHTLTRLHEEEDGIISPVPVLRALAWHGWSRDLQQQDCHELYHVFLATLAEEKVCCSSLLGETLTPLDQTTVSVAYGRAGVCVCGHTEPCVRWCASVSGAITTLPGHATAACPLQGLLTSELICMTCHHTSPVTYEAFDSLSLNLPFGQRECSLHSCLLDFIKSEAVAGVECSACSKTAGSSVKRTFMKQFSVARLPQILCLHLKRTVWHSSGYLHKSSASVTFSSLLDLSALCKCQLRGCHYELKAVVEHLGGPLSGHYVTYRQLKGRQWVYTSDIAVHCSSLPEVLSSSPYMLFYEQTYK